MTVKAPVIAAIGALLGFVSGPTPTHSDPCRPVSGLISAEAGRLVPTLKGLRIRGSGVSDGSLAGDVVLEVLKPFLGSDVRVAFTIADSAGPLVASGTAEFSDTPHEDVFAIRSELRVTDAAARGGAYRGSVTGIGQVDRRARTVAVAYSGELCTAPAARQIAAAAPKGGSR